MDAVKESTADAVKAKPEAPKAKAPERVRKVNKNGLVTVRYLGSRFTPMKYEVWVNGGMVKLAFGTASPTTQVAPAVADVLTGKTKQQYDGNRPVNAVIALGKISDPSGERWTEV